MKTGTGGLQKVVITLAAAAFVAACSSSGSGGALNNPPPPPGTGGIIGSGVSIGPIDNFGSMFVHGRELDTSTATFTKDGQPASETDFRVGQIVTITGTFDANGVSGTADSVTYDDNVEGEITSIDIMNSQFEVLGQTVLVDPTLVIFDDDINPRSLTGLMVGDNVEVSGFVTAAGDIQATRIELQPAGTEFEVTGVIATGTLDTTAMQFNINALVVDYSTAMLDDFPGGTPAEGDLVEAKGNSLGAGNELLATRVEWKNPGLPGEEDDEIELEGLISLFVSPVDFQVAGKPVTTNGQTQYENGAESDLMDDVLVEVKGLLDAMGVLVAREIDFEQDSNVEIEATADANGSGTTITILGITVNKNDSTRMEDKRDNVMQFDIPDIMMGDFLHIVGFEDAPGSGNVTATRIEREDFDPDVVLQGTATTAVEPNIVILGVSGITDAATQYFDENDTVIADPAMDFWPNAANRTVKIKDDAAVIGVPPVLDIDEAELEN